MAIPENEKKFAELILYVSQKSTFDSTFGSTKLNKILYFSDFLAYGKLGVQSQMLSIRISRKGLRPDALCLFAMSL